MTIKEIAQICGVSRGTVDRVLNNRGGVSPEKENLIRSFIDKCGYVPNYSAKALAARKKDLEIGVILFSDQNPFFADIIHGINRAIDEYHYYGIPAKIKVMDQYSEEEQLKLIDELSSSISALIIDPINTKRIADKINKMHDQGIPTFTVGGDLENSKRLRYIGTDYLQSGKLAAGIFRIVAPPNASIGIISGVSDESAVLGHDLRLRGFIEHLKETRPDIAIKGILPSEDNDFTAYENTSKMLEQYKDISFIQVLTAGLNGVYHAIKKSNRPIGVIAFDLSPVSEKMLKEGIAKAIVIQHPDKQGFMAYRVACEYIINGFLPQEYDTALSNELIIPENLS